MKKILYGSLAVLVIAYLYCVLFLQSDSSTLSSYAINATLLRFISITIVIPLIIAWFAAFIGVVNVAKYTKYTKGSPEVRGFKYLTAGLVVLAFLGPLRGVIGRLLAYAGENGVVTHTFETIVTTRLNVVGHLVAFILLLLGAHYLVKTVKKARVPEHHMVLTAMLLAVISSVYTSIVFHNPSREVAVVPSQYATYATTDWITIATIVIPNILLWGCGLYVALLLNSYHNNVSGVLYGKSLRRMKWGFLIVILSTMILQIISATSGALTGWATAATLILLYVLIVVSALGYIGIALGAKGLARMEEIT